MNENPFSVFIAICVLMVSIGLLVAFSIGLGNALTDASNLDTSLCQNITVNDTFTTTSGGMASVYSNYYISSNGKTYEMYITDNPALIGRWHSMVKGNSYLLKVNNTHAAFCDQKILSVGK